MSKSLKRVRNALEAAGEVVDILEMEGSTRTAAEAAAEAGCDVDQIAKSIIFRGTESGELFLFLTAGGNQVDPALATSLAGQALGKADAAEIRSETGFAIGGVSPVGHLKPVRSFFDPRLSEFTQVWAAAGTPRHMFAICPARLRELTGAQAAAFTGQVQPD